MKSVNSLLAADSSHKEWVPLIEVATREVFEMMLGCKLEQPAIAVDGPFDVTAMVGLAGQIRGLFTVRCAAKSATLMASKMIGMELAEGSRDVLDALGEICNMVAGNFKNKVAGLDDGCFLSVPTVITGNYRVHSLADSAAIEVRLLFEGMPIIISLQVHS